MPCNTVGGVGGGGVENQVHACPGAAIVSSVQEPVVLEAAEGSVVVEKGLRGGDSVLVVGCNEIIPGTEVVVLL